MDNLIKSATRWLLYLLAVSLIIYAAFPKWKAVTFGLALGLLASAMNAFLLKRRVHFIADAATQEGTGGRRGGLGLVSRISTVLLLAMIGFKYPEVVNLPAALAGCMVMPFLILVAAIIHNMKEIKGGKG